VEHGVEPARGEPAGDCRDASGPDASSALTETELRVVELVASGLNDRAIASLLSLSPDAVQANLRRVYCKLGITTRAALAADRTVLATGGDRDGRRSSPKPARVS